MSPWEFFFIYIFFYWYYRFPPQQTPLPTVLNHKPKSGHTKEKRKKKEVRHNNKRTIFAYISSVVPKHSEWIFGWFSTSKLTAIWRSSVLPWSANGGSHEYKWRTDLAFNDSAEKKDFRSIKINTVGFLAISATF